MVQGVTDLGDLGLLLPMAALLTGYFLLRGSLTLTCAWLAALAFCGFATLALKLGYSHCVPSHELPINPSGHASSSTAVYGCVALAWSRNVARGGRAVVVAAVLAGLIGLSRIWLQLHSAGEVVLGFGIGLLAIFVFSALSKGATLRGVSWWWVASAFGVLIAISHGHRIDTASQLRKLSSWLSATCS
jgi:membrane-associated phospholipid phosphatase